MLCNQLLFNVKDTMHLNISLSYLLLQNLFLLGRKFLSNCKSPLSTKPKSRIPLHKLLSIDNILWLFTLSYLYLTCSFEAWVLLLPLLCWRCSCERRTLNTTTDWQMAMEPLASVQCLHFSAPHTSSQLSWWPVQGPGHFHQ